MQRKYSDKLIRECQRVMSKRAGFALSEDQAEECLDRLAQLGDIAVRIMAARREKEKSKKRKLCDR